MKKRQQRKMITEINVVPYIDVMLVLLMVFMLTAPLLTQGVQVHLPKAKAKVLNVFRQKPIILSIDKSGHYYLNIHSQPTLPISQAQLYDEVGIALGRAKQQHQKREVYVQGDQMAQYAWIVKAMVLLQKAGADDVGLITEPSTNKALKTAT